MTTGSIPAGRNARVFAAALGVAVPAGCATFSGDGGFGAVEQVVRERLNKDAKWKRDDGERGMAGMGSMGCRCRTTRFR